MRAPSERTERKVGEGRRPEVVIWLCQGDPGPVLCTLRFYSWAQMGLGQVISKDLVP